MQAHKLFKKRFSKSSLRDIYFKYVHYTSSTGIDGIIANDKYDYESEIELINKKVTSGKYKFSKYKEKLISKGAGKEPRVISIPTVRDRIVIKALHLFLQDVYPASSKTLIPQLMLSNISSEVKKTKYKSFIKVDIKNFYPSIDHDLLLKKTFKRIRKSEIKSLIEKAIKNNTGNIKPKSGVPQGLAISNILAEIYLEDLDFNYKSDKNISYNRYVDDILVLSKDTRPKKLLDGIISDFSNLKLTCHNYDDIGSKTKIDRLYKSFDFLGYWIENRKLTVKKESIWKVENSIAKIINSHKYISKPKSYITENKLNLRITGCIYEGKRRGWLFYYSQLEDETILYKLDSTVKKMLKQAKLDKIIKQKKFSKSYKECKRDVLDNHQYIVNFDGYSLPQKRELLTQFMDPEKVSILDNQTINSLFSKRVRHLIKDLEEDIRENS
ncbi:reverse transcriptase domain-containing protein [Vibrio fluvialis]